MMATRTPPERRRAYQKSGIHTLKRAVQVLGARALPTKRTALGRALAAWRAGLVADLGGEDAISTQQRALVDLAVRTKLLVDSIDAYVLALPSPVNRQKHCLFPVVRERQSLVGQFQGLLRDLGLERRAKDVPDLAAYIASRGKVRGGHSESGNTGKIGNNHQEPQATQGDPVFPESESEAGSQGTQGT